MSKVGLTFRWLVVPVSFIAFNSVTMAADCGPGDHWVDDCPAGIDRSGSMAKVQIKVPCDQIDAPEIELSGPVKIERQAGIPHRIDTEMLSLKLTDGTNTVRAGKDAVPEWPRPVYGEIIEQPGNPSLADSYFDVYVAVDTNSGTLFSKEACHMVSEIDRVPPVSQDPTQIGQNTYVCDNVGPEGLPLYLWTDSNGNEQVDESELSTLPTACLTKALHALAVELDYFTATLDENGGVSLAWKTGSETENAGFLVLRDKPENDECTQNQDNYLSPIPLAWYPTQGSQGTGADYFHYDPDGNVTDCYGLLDIDMNGKQEVHIVPVTTE